MKLKGLGDEKTLHPDVTQTLEAAETLVEDGFDVMVYTSDDPVIAKRLEAIGCCSVMPLAAPIGSGLGVCNGTVSDPAAGGDTLEDRPRRGFGGVRP